MRVLLRHVRLFLLAAVCVWLLFQLDLVANSWFHSDGRPVRHTDSTRSHTSHASRPTVVDDVDDLDSAALARLRAQQLCVLGSGWSRSGVEEWMAEWVDTPAMWATLTPPASSSTSEQEQRVSAEVEAEEKVSSYLAVRPTTRRSLSPATASAIVPLDSALSVAAKHFGSHFHASDCQYYLLADAGTRLQLRSQADSGVTSWTAVRDTLLGLLRQHQPLVLTFTPPRTSECSDESGEQVEGVASGSTVDLSGVVTLPVVVHRSLLPFLFRVDDSGRWQYTGSGSALSLLPAMYPHSTLSTASTFRSVRADCSERAGSASNYSSQAASIARASKRLQGGPASTFHGGLSVTVHSSHSRTDYLRLLDDAVDILHPLVVDNPWVRSIHSPDNLRTIRASGCSPRLALIVFTFNRLTSLQRLLKSVLASDYSGWEAVSLQVHADYSDVQDDIRQYLDNFTWPFGPVSRTYANRSLGLRDSILHAWQPSTLDEFAVFLEDDVEVSAEFARWVRVAVQSYYYAVDGLLRDSPLVGVSLYAPVWSERVDQPFAVDPTFPVYGMQAPSSWGAVYFPAQWSDFRQWQRLHAHSDPLVPGLGGINGWNSTRSWKKYLVRYLVERGAYMLYPNRADRLSFSTNHHEAGTNVDASSNRDWRDVLDARYTVPLVPAADQNRWYGQHNALLMKHMRVIDIFDRAVTLTPRLRIPAIPEDAWRAYSRLTIAIALASASPEAQAAVTTALQYWQALPDTALRELVVQLPAHLNFTCPPLRTPCSVNRAAVSSVDSYLWPLPLPHSSAVLLLHPLLRAKLRDVVDLFHVWQRRPDRVVALNGLTRSYRFVDNAYAEWDVGLPQLTLASHSALLLSSHYLDLYWSDERSFHSALRRAVARRGRGEEVALQRLVTNITSRWPVLLHRPVTSSGGGSGRDEWWHQPTQLYAADLEEARQAYGMDWPWLNGRTEHVTHATYEGAYQLPDTVAEATPNSSGTGG